MPQIYIMAASNPFGLIGTGAGLIICYRSPEKTLFLAAPPGITVKWRRKILLLKHKQSSAVGRAAISSLAWAWQLLYGSRIYSADHAVGEEAIKVCPYF